MGRRDRSAGTPASEHERVHRIEFAVDWPPGHVAAYLVGGPEPLLIDAGMAGERGREELLAGVTAAGYDVADVAHLLLTHPHVDHVGQAGAVIAEAEPTVYAPMGVRERLSRDPDDLARAVGENAIAAGVTGDERGRAIEMAVDSLERNRRLLAPAAVDRWIGTPSTSEASRATESVERDDGDRTDGFDTGPSTDDPVIDDSTTGALVRGTITVADHTFAPIPTPGHQVDHHCYVTDIADERVLFAGDTVLAPFRPVLLHVGLDGGVEAGIDAFETSLDRLSGRAIDRVFPGHGPVHTAFRETLDRDRRSLGRLVDGVSSRLDVETGTTAAEIARERAGGKRDFAYLLPEVVAALSRLDATGRARVTTDEAGTRRYRSA